MAPLAMEDQSMDEKRTKPMLIGDLQSWDLDKDGNVVDQAEYEKWAAATINWSFGGSADSGGAEHGKG
jgi:hypothetical protein